MSRNIVIGIYCITNNINNKRYIGQSKDIYKRWSVHICLLNKGEHDNKHLQNSWSKYGESNFSFTIIEECDEECLDERECYYILKYNTIDSNFGYNLQCGGGVNRIIREETRLKLIEAAKKSHMNYVPGSRIGHMKGGHLSEETKEKLRQAHLGKKASEETKKKLSAMRTGSKNSNCKPVYCPELDESFWGAKEAQDKYGFNRNHISSCINGKRKHCGIHPITGEKLTWVKLENNC